MTSFDFTLATQECGLSIFSPLSASHESEATAQCEMFLLVHVKRGQTFLSPTLYLSHTAVLKSSATLKNPGKDHLKVFFQAVGNYSYYVEHFIFDPPFSAFVTRLLFWFACRLYAVFRSVRLLPLQSPRGGFPNEKHDA